MSPIQSPRESDIFTSALQVQNYGKESQEIFLLKFLSKVFQNLPVPLLKKLVFCKTAGAKHKTALKKSAEILFKNHIISGACARNDWAFLDKSCLTARPPKRVTGSSDLTEIAWLCQIQH